MTNEPKPINPLVAEYALENLEAVRSYAVSATEALLRGDTKSSSIYFDCIRLCGREVAECFKNLETK